jgi:hypothetical protein
MQLSCHPYWQQILQEIPNVADVSSKNRTDCSKFQTESCSIWRDSFTSSPISQILCHFRELRMMAASVLASSSGRAAERSADAPSSKRETSIGRNAFLFGVTNLNSQRIFVFNPLFLDWICGCPQHRCRAPCSRTDQAESARCNLAGSKQPLGPHRTGSGHGRAGRRETSWP